MKFNVSTLIGRSTFEMGMVCLKSFVEHCKDDILLSVYEDGTLNKDDRQMMVDQLKNVQLVSREERDDIVFDRIRNYPNALRYKRVDFLSAKLLDIPLMMPQQYGYIDADIFFLKDFIDFDRRRFKEELVNMQDLYDCYSISFFTRYLSGSRIRMPDQVNVGMCYVDKMIHDLDYLEWFLGKEEYTSYNNGSWRKDMLDQTGFALLAARTHSHLFNPRQILIPVRLGDITAQTVAAHLTSLRRSLFKDIVRMRKPSNPDAGPVQLTTIPVTYSGILRAVSKRLVYKGKRLVHMI